MSILYKYYVMKYVTFNTEKPYLHNCETHVERNINI